MTCEPEKVTGLIDAALSGEELAAVEVHIAECPECQAQAESERTLAARLRALPAPEPPPGLEERVRARFRARRRSPARWLLPLAAALAVVAFWVRGSAPFVAWELARDHSRCFAHSPLPAEIWTSSPAELLSWFDEHGSRLPLVPASVDGLELVGGRHCPLPGLSLAPHVYYSDQRRRLSLFVVPRSVRMGEASETEVHGYTVRLIRVAGLVVGVVGDRREDVEAMAEGFRTAVVRQAIHNPHAG